MVRHNYKKLYEDLLKDNKENILIESLNDMKKQYDIYIKQYHDILEKNVQMHRIIVGVNQISNFLINEYHGADDLNSLFELIHYLTDI